MELQKSFFDKPLLRAFRCSNFFQKPFLQVLETFLMSLGMCLSIPERFKHIRPLRIDIDRGKDEKVDFGKMKLRHVKGSFKKAFLTDPY